MRRGLISWSRDEVPPPVLEGRVARLQEQMRAAGLGVVLALSSGSKVRIAPSDAPLAIENRTYRGAIEVFGNKRNTLTIVNELPAHDIHVRVKGSA